MLSLGQVTYPSMTVREHIFEERSVGDGVVLLTLCRARQRNAFTAELYDAVCDALVRHSSPECADTRVIVLAGRGPSFCGGMDLKEVVSSPQAQTKASRKFMYALARCPKVVVVAGECLPCESLRYSASRSIHLARSLR
jgi:enoyl-CoA hydratase/carnithine racemase